MKEVGTLKELDVKPGDVVEYVKGFDGMYPDYIGKRMIGDDHGGVKFGYNNGFSVCVGHIFRIISRAADTPKLWCDMTDAEKGALLLARHEGKVIEYKRYDGGWFPSCGDFVGFGAYRVRPEPKVEVVTIHHWEVVTNVINGHHITFNTIDGKPDTTSIKMEAI